MKTIVQTIERELGWGARLLDEEEFDSYEEAVAYCKEMNNKYCADDGYVPDSYIYCEIKGEYGPMKR